MASIHRNSRSPKGVWYAALRLAEGQRVQRSTGTRDKAKAKIITEAWQAAEDAAANAELSQERVLEILNETLKRIGLSRIEYVTVETWLQDWLASKKSSAAPATLTMYRHAVTEFLRFLGPDGSNRRLESITERDIESFLEQLRRDGRGPVTVNKLRRFIGLPFEKARKLGKIRYNPVAVTSPAKEDSTPKETFTGEQVAALVQAGAGTDWAGLVIFAYGTGARLGDAATLKWSALDVALGVVAFRERKTGAEAVLGLHPDFTDWLADQPARDDPTGFVFPTLAGQPLAGEKGLSNGFAALMDKAGIEKRLKRQRGVGKGRSVRALSFHSFRHTAATTVFAQASLREITRRVTNHAAGGVVDNYIHHDIEAIRAATLLIPRLPRPTGGQT